MNLCALFYSLKLYIPETKHTSETAPIILPRIESVNDIVSASGKLLLQMTTCCLLYDGIPVLQYRRKPAFIFRMKAGC